MRIRLLSVLVISALPLMLISCRRAESQQSLKGTKDEPHAVSPDTKAAPQEDLPKGKGMLTVLVEDEKGNPIQGAEIRIANNRGETYKTASRKDGTTKGAGPVSENPFTVTVMLSGFEAQQVQGIALGEDQPVFVRIKLKRASE